MTLQTAKYSNFFETTADGNIGASDTSITLSAAPTSDGTSAISAPFYLVIDPDTATKREVILVTASSGVTMSTVTRDVEGRHATDPSHADGVTIRMAVIGEMFEDLHDRINDVALTGDVTGTISSTTQDVATTIAAGAVDFAMIADTVDEDDMTSNSATKLPTQQSVKAYVDSGATTLTNKILKDYAETEQAVTSATTLAIDLADGNCGSVTLAHNVTDIDFTNVPTDFATFTLVVTQDATGSRTMAIDAVTVNGDSHQTAKTAGGAGLTLSTAPSSIDILTFLFVDETPYLFSQLAFS